MSRIRSNEDRLSLTAPGKRWSIFFSWVSLTGFESQGNISWLTSKSTRSKQLFQADCPESYSCCSSPVPLTSLFDSHMNDSAPTKTKSKSLQPCRCTVAECGKLFSKRSNLKAHMRVHNGFLPYPCIFPWCSKRFRWKSSLKPHVRVHLADGDVLSSSALAAAHLPERTLQNCTSTISNHENEDLSRFGNCSARNDETKAEVTRAGFLTLRDSEPFSISSFCEPMKSANPSPVFQERTSQETSRCCRSQSFQSEASCSSAPVCLKSGVGTFDYPNNGDDLVKYIEVETDDLWKADIEVVDPLGDCDFEYNDIEREETLKKPQENE